ncbi:hypothetical protein JMJ56_32270 [Belnapia sp. T18]|uniref:Uncharacterized protein n=2 Tax=Belnapia arida TaxID=2804533 RepID=A0ABS1UG09_9PROT|nr:hypothetical protein [Belnapia arida]
MAIGRELDERGLTKPVEIGAALGLPPAEAAKLLTRHQWRKDDVEQLEAAAARLGLLEDDGCHSSFTPCRVRISNP